MRRCEPSGRRDARRIVALIPARAGSKRVKGKNVRPLAGHPAIAYSIAAARDSGIFSAIVVSTDSEHYAAIARYYGAEVPFLRPAALAGDQSPDIDWVEHALRALGAQGRTFEYFSILRPTSPFRTADTIRRAWAAFEADGGAESLRAVERCAQHPGKMWVIRGRRMLPLLPLGPAALPWHSQQYAALPEIYVQNASLEIGRSRVVLDGRTIAGETVLPFLTTGAEGFDINNPVDLRIADEMVRSAEAVLPAVGQAPWASEAVA
jgi:CMP-N,N'-diacetyllegionaminic acid synthase